MNRRFAVCLLLFVMTIASAASSAQDSREIPDLTLSVATRRHEDERVGKWIHVFRLRCDGGRCELAVITLNQCVENLAGAPIVLQTYRQDAGELRVSRRRPDTLNVEFDHLAGTSRLKIGFEVVPIGEYSRTTVTSFSGGYLHRSGVPERMTFIEYVPLHGRYKNVALDCQVELPGVEE